MARKQVRARQTFPAVSGKPYQCIFPRTKVYFQPIVVEPRATKTGWRENVFLFAPRSSNSNGRLLQFIEKVNDQEARICGFT